jgi:hypothetical protein
MMKPLSQPLAKIGLPSFGILALLFGRGPRRFRVSELTFLRRLRCPCRLRILFRPLSFVRFSLDFFFCSF